MGLAVIGVVHAHERNSVTGNVHGRNLTRVGAVRQDFWIVRIT
jgi:hypothetical protein